MTVSASAVLVPDAVARPAARMHHLDWLRVIAVLAVFFHHVTAIFAGHSFISDANRSSFAEMVVVTLKHWRMPLLFFVAGAAAYFALNERSWHQYLVSRSQRLAVPLILGTLIILPYIGYYRHLSSSDIVLSYHQFYPQFFEAMIPEGHFTLYHLWFIAYLVIYTALLLPLFLYVRSSKAQQLFSYLGALFTNHRTILLLPALPLAAAQIVLRRLTLERWYIIDDWAHFAFYLLIFLYGYALTGMPGFWKSIEQHRRTFLLIGAGLAAVLPVIYLGFGALYSGPAIRFIPQMIMISLCSWCLVLALVGYGKRYLNVHNPVMRYAADASYPFFVLHQAAVVIVGFHVVQMEIPSLAKFILIAGLAFVATVLAYETLIRRFRVTRFLFGMRVLAKP